MVCEDIGAAVLKVSVLGKGCESILGLFRRVSVPFQVHQVSSGDWEQLLLLCLLVCIVFCLVVQEDPEDGCHHAQDVGAGDGVAQHDQGHRDHHDSLGGVGHRVAEGTDQVKDTEGNDILGKITESTDYKQHQGPGPMRHCAQVILYQEGRKIHQNPRWDHEEHSVAPEDVQQPKMMNSGISQHLLREDVLK